MCDAVLVEVAVASLIGCRQFYALRVRYYNLFAHARSWIVPLRDPQRIIGTRADKTASRIREGCERNECGKPCASVDSGNYFGGYARV
jgi:hypothetical protein